MLRTLLVLAVYSFGIFHAFRSPFYGLLLYLGTAYFRPEQWVSNDFIANLNLSLLAGILVVVSTFISRQKPRSNWPIALLAMFFCHTLAATVLAEHFDWSWKYWQDLAKVLIITYLMPVLITDRRRLRLAVLVIALSLGLEAAKQGVLGLILQGGDRNVNEHPLLGDNNGVALGMMMLIPLLSVLAQTSGTALERYSHRFLLAGSLLRGLLTYSRGGFLAAMAVGLGLCFRSRFRFRMLGALAVTGVIAMSVLPPSFWERMNTIQASEEDQDASTQGRLHFWHTALVMASAHPLAGVGVNGFQTSYDTYDDSRGQFGHERAVHSTWFGVASDLGVTGCALFALLLLSMFFIYRRVRRDSRECPALAELVPYANAFETSLIAYCVAGTFLNAQYFEMFWHLLGLTIALQLIAENMKHATPAVAAPALNQPVYRWPYVESQAGAAVRNV